MSRGIQKQIDESQKQLAKLQEQYTELLGESEAIKTRLTALQAARDAQQQVVTELRRLASPAAQ